MAGLPGNRTPRKRGQLLLKIWWPDGSRLETKTTADHIDNEEFARHCDAFAEMLKQAAISARKAPGHVKG